jgi:2'-5' RNA ligase
MRPQDDGAQVWERFERGPLTLPETPGVRESWHRGRARYAVWLLRAQDPAVQVRAAQVAASLGDALEPQPRADLHVTVFVAGFPVPATGHNDDVRNDDVHNDDTSWQLLTNQAERVHHLLEQPLSLQLGSANSFLSAPFLEVEDPGDDLATLRAALGEVAPEVRFAPYRPHLTVGRYVHAVATKELAALLRPWRALSPLHLPCTHLELATFDAGHPGAPLVTALVVPL